MFCQDEECEEADEDNEEAYDYDYVGLEGDEQEAVSGHDPD